MMISQLRQSILRLLTSNFRHLLLLSVFICGSFLSASASTLTGTVRNGSTGKPAAGVDIVLIALQGGMETVASARTDAQGRFTLDNAAVGAQPMLVRALYRGVNFHASLPPGRTTAEIEVFEPTRDARVIEVTSRLLVFQPNGPTLLVGEEYTIKNSSKPPAAYFRPDGNFDFATPAGVVLGQVSAWGPSGMPVVQGTIDRGPQQYSVAFPFRPGESGVRFTYQVPYPENSARIHFPSGRTPSRVVLVVPPTVKISGDGFSPTGSQDGWSVYARDSVPAGGFFDVVVSGTAPPSPADAQEGQGTAPARAVTSDTLPTRLGNLQWILVAGFAALFVIGVIFLWRRPALQTATAGGSVSPPLTGPGPRERSRRSKSPPAPPSPAGPAPDLAQLDLEVSGSLDQLKDSLFRLELRRQAGSISEEDYQRERSRIEERLRSLLQG